MDVFKVPCTHRSVPVETDESMMSSCLDLVSPYPCDECSGAESGRRPHQDHAAPPTQIQQGPRVCALPPEPCFTPLTHPGHMRPPCPAGVWPQGFRVLAPLPEWQRGADLSADLSGPSDWPQNCSVEEAGSLEAPLPLISDTKSPCVPSLHHTHCPPPNQGSPPRRCPCCAPKDLHQPRPSHSRGDHPAHPPPLHHQRDRRLSLNRQEPRDASLPQSRAPPSVMQEIRVNYSYQACPVPSAGEVKRTISLPEECRSVFITYSVDTAQEIRTFTKFLIDQGFKPAIDIFDNPVRRMDTTKWMDRYLNDKSMLIIVVISPKYKEDVEGVGDDDHGLHTKYIHNQIQNEFIQQGCLNFRLIPVVFPNGCKRHVPNWLRSTRIYRWPQDRQDLLLRLLREERYIIPQRGADLTLTIRPL